MELRLKPYPRTANSGPLPVSSEQRERVEGLGQSRPPRLPVLAGAQLGDTRTKLATRTVFDCVRADTLLLENVIGLGYLLATKLHRWFLRVASTLVRASFKKLLI